MKKEIYTPEHERVLAILQEYASKKKTISYSELIQKAKLKLDMSIPYDRGQIGHLLGDISWNESIDGRPMLSSIALHKRGDLQGQGFFELAEKIYGIKLKTEDAKLVFGMNEMEKTHSYWSTKP